MEQIHRDDIDRLKRGDILTVRTVTQNVDQHNTPNRMRGVGAKNKWSGPNWIDVTGEDIKYETWYRVKVRRSDSRLVRVVKLAEDTPRKTILRKEREIADFSNMREESVEWEGTPHERTEKKDITKEDDIRGDKNDLLGGHL